MPSDVLAKARGQQLVLSIAAARAGDPAISTTITLANEVKISLRTADPNLAKARTGEIEAQLQRFYAATRQGPQPLTKRQIVALAGILYRAFVEALEDDPGSPQIWQRVEDLNAQALAGDFDPMKGLRIAETPDMSLSPSLETRFGGLLTSVLSREGVVVDADHRALLLIETLRQMNAAAATLKRRARGDYRADEHAATLPDWSAVKPSKSTKRTVLGLFEEWANIAAPAKRIVQRTIDGYRATFNRFVVFLGHDDADRLTDEDVIGFAEARLAEGISPKTVNAADLAALKSVFSWAVKTKRLARSPAAGFSVPSSRRISERSKGFTDQEAEAILTAALAYRPKPLENENTAAAKKWVPWICAHSGARVGEATQLRKADIQRREDHWVFVITPAAGTVKNKKRREVPVHPQLIELGFITFVEGASDGPLFRAPSKCSKAGRKTGGVDNRLREFIREIVPDSEVQPNHAWRHRFQTVCRRYGVDQELRRMITGHRGLGVDETEYGDPAGLFREIEKLPYYLVAQQAGSVANMPEAA